MEKVRDGITLTGYRPCFTCIIPLRKREYSMNSLPTLKHAARHRSPSAARTFSEFRAHIDHRVLRIFDNKSLKRSLRQEVKINLDDLWERTARAIEQQEHPLTGPMLEQLDIHQ